MEWKPIFGTMMGAPGLSIPSKRDDIDEAFVQSSYFIATDHLKSCFSYIFTKSAAILSSYTIGTWSHKIKPSVVRKYGTALDVARLPPTTPRNNPHRTKPQQRRRRVRKVVKAGAGRRAAMALVENDKKKGDGTKKGDGKCKDDGKGKDDNGKGKKGDDKGKGHGRQRSPIGRCRCGVPSCWR